MKELYFNKRVIYSFIETVDKYKVKCLTKIGSNFYNKDLYCSFSEGKSRKGNFKEDGLK